MEDHPPSHSPQPKRRGGVACRRCRRLRAKCVHQAAQPPCEGCRTAGARAATECSFPRRGEKDLDRDFRRRRRQDQDSSASGLLPPGPQRHILESGGHHGEISAFAIAASSIGTVVPVDTTQSCTGIVGEDLHASVVEQASRHGEDGGVRRGNEQVGLWKPPRNQDRCLDSEGDRARPPSIRREVQSEFSDFNPQFPPHDEIVQGCRVFITSYFQLGFTPKTIFMETVSGENWEDCVGRFLLVCILGISARFTPPLVRRYGSPSKVTEFFMTMASQMVPTEMYLKPSLERIQAFFLLAIAEWGNGDKDRSSIHMAIAVRMASILKLHREETYRLLPDASPDDVVRSESARRTFWMIQSQENLHSGHNTPTPFSPGEVTTLLPCNESDFGFGVVPLQRAALPGTPPATDPSLVFSPARSLFATLVQAHSLWGQVARRACRPEQSPDQNAPTSPAPWDEESEFHALTHALQEWEERMPPRHKWSAWNLRGWKAESLHLAYLSVVMVLRLSNIVIRRIYLDDLITNSTSINNNAISSPSPDAFWPSVSHSLFANVAELHEQIDAYFSARAPDEGFPAILVFCVYVCGSLASYLWRYPKLCPERAASAASIARRSLEVLTELQGAWPAAVRWQKGLKQAQEKSAASAVQPPGGNLQDLESTELSACTCGAQSSEARAPVDSVVSGVAVVMPESYSQQPAVVADIDGQFPDVNAFPNEWFDAEFTAFLQGDMQYGPWAS